MAAGIGFYGNTHFPNAPERVRRPDGAIRVTINSDLQAPSDEVLLPEEYIEAQKRIDSFSRLPGNWDGQGGQNVTAATAHLGIDVLYRIVTLAGAEELSVPPPIVSPSPCGSIGLEWRTMHGYLAVECEPEGTISLLLERDGDEIEREAASIEDLWETCKPLFQN